MLVGAIVEGEHANGNGVGVHDCRDGHELTMSLVGGGDESGCWDGNSVGAFVSNT